MYGDNAGRAAGGKQLSAVLGLSSEFAHTRPDSASLSTCRRRMARARSAAGQISTFTTF